MKTFIVRIPVQGTHNDFFSGTCAAFYHDDPFPDICVVLYHASTLLDACPDLHRDDPLPGTHNPLYHHDPLQVHVPAVARWPMGRRRQQRVDGHHPGHLG